MDGTISAVMQGTLLTALAQGMAAGLAYWALGVRFSIFLGALSAVLSLLPFGGTSLVWIPVAIYLFITGSIMKGCIMIGIGAGLVGLLDNLLQPFLIGNKAQLPMLFLSLPPWVDWLRSDYSVSSSVPLFWPSCWKRFGSIRMNFRTSRATFSSNNRSPE